MPPKTTTPATTPRKGGPLPPEEKIKFLIACLEETARPDMKKVAAKLGINEGAARMRLSTLVKGSGGTLPSGRASAASKTTPAKKRAASTSTPTKSGKGAAKAARTEPIDVDADDEEDDEADVKPKGSVSDDDEEKEEEERAIKSETENGDDEVVDEV